MTPFTYQPDPRTLEAIAEALRSVPRAAYSVPHDYPSSAPAYTAAPMAERERPVSDQLRLYAHVPFCRYHCTFCYFAVRVGASAALMQRYVRAVIKELEWIEPGTPLSQLLVGGGTPTALPPDLLDELLGAIFARTTRYGKHVHTVETSPETISAEHIAVLKRHGVGRVSMGVQSLDSGSSTRCTGSRRRATRWRPAISSWAAASSSTSTSSTGCRDRARRSSGGTSPRWPRAGCPPSPCTAFASTSAPQ